MLATGVFEGMKRGLTRAECLRRAQSVPGVTLPVVGARSMDEIDVLLGK